MFKVDIPYSGHEIKEGKMQEYNRMRIYTDFTDLHGLSFKNKEQEQECFPDAS